jgi:uncharacterized membrane protein
MKLDWRIEWPQWLLITSMFVAAALLWSSAPARIPVHWNIYGQVDRYGGRLEGVLLVPLVAMGVYCLLLFIPRIDPGRANYEQFAHAYAALRLAILFFLAAVYALMQAASRGYAVSIATVVGNLGVGTLLVVVGNFLAKVRPNWFIGIRTPWTLSSKTAWDKTHRLAAWLFVIAGLLTIADIAVPLPWRVIPMVALPACAALIATIYSYLVWRTATDKIPPADTMPA